MSSPRPNDMPRGNLKICEVGPRFDLTRLGILTLAMLSALLLVAARPAQAQTETVLYNFTGGSDGAHPQSRLTADGKGNLFGTTYQGGTSGPGTVFELSPNGSGGWNETVLHSFSGGLDIGPDGAGPSGPVIFDSAGNLYGTTRFGGTDYIYCSYGTVFELSPAGASWTETIPFSECPQGDGIAPMNGLIIDPAGNLYGTSLENGPVPGAVFELSPSVGGRTYQRIFSAPTSSGLTMDGAGDIYGATSSTVFELSPNGNGGWNPTIIHTFAGYPYDGTLAEGTPVLDQFGNLYGTTYQGGVYNRGTVYMLSRGQNGEWTENILYSFPGGKNGANPAPGIVFDAAGNIYGTTALGGRNGHGTVFELAALGSSHYQQTVLWTFNGTDGEDPLGSLILDKASNLYGTTNSGGSSNAGVVFEVTGVRLAPATTLTSSLNPSIYGQKVIFTATVTTSGSLSPTGTVAFTWRGGLYTIGIATLNSSGVATLIKSNLNADTYPLNAVYKGDANNLGSWSPVLNQLVLQTRCAAAITSSANPSTLGQAVTFTARITSPTVTPTGPVTFAAGKTVLGTAQLSGGKATLTISSLAAGSTKVNATYYGDSNIAKSSASVIQTVQ
jgi:uncharacterized repeat protein (TIGR03803 family)